MQEIIGDYYNGKMRCYDEFCKLKTTYQIRLMAGFCPSFECSESRVKSNILEQRANENLVWLRNIFKVSDRYFFCLL